jgi:hypothetical protein
MVIPHVSNDYRKSPAVAGITEAVAVHHRFPHAVQDIAVDRRAGCSGGEEDCSGAEKTPPKRGFPCA